MQRLSSALAIALLLLGVLGIGVAVHTTSTSHTRDGRQVTDVRVGLAGSPLYVSHREAPVGGVSGAIHRGQEVVIASDSRWDWMSWSGLMVVLGIAATTWSVVTLARMRKSA